MATTIDGYVRARQIELARNINARKKIYLDTRFWIILRDAQVGLSASPPTELLEAIKDGVAKKRLICPISQSVFIEVMKQAYTPERRIGTVALIDELSGGVSLIDDRMRIGTEIAHFLYANTGKNDLHPAQDLVWTKLAYALGYLHPHLPQTDAALELHVQKSFFDHMWEIGLSEIANIIGPSRPRDTLKESAARINQEIKSHAQGLVSYERTYRDEVIGAIDLCGDVALEVLRNMAIDAGVRPVGMGSAEYREFSTVCKNLLVAAFDKSIAQGTLRTIHVQASLHAGLRWQKRTNFTDHHFYDFDHAAGAVAYCDAFFTEGFLSNLLNANHIRLDMLNGCQITDSTCDAIRIVYELVNGPRQLK